MSTRTAGNKRQPAQSPRRPLWRRLNRHMLFLLHVVLYLAGGTWIWTLNAPTLDKQFDVLLWLTILSAHGLIVYRSRRAAFVLHLLMFCAGNGAIWTTTAPVSDRFSVTLAWVFVAGGLGLWLARRQYSARANAPAPQRKPRARKAEAPLPETDWYDPPDEDTPPSGTASTGKQRKPRGS